MGGLFYGILLSIALALFIPSVEAIPYPDNTNTVSIQLSQSCRTMLENNVTSDCPTYEQLYRLGWDDSLPGTGEFYYDENGMFERGAPTYKQVHELYRFHDNHILLDPPTEIATRSKLIIISPSLPVYIPTGGYDKVDHQRIIAKDRYVDNCKVATITAENWEFMISDTIYYLRSNCERTSFVEVETVTDYISSMNRETSRQYKYDQWFDQAAADCKLICKEY